KYNESMFTCILLAAGLSSRFGSSKALVPLDENETLIEHLQDTLIQSVVNHVVVVLGANADLTQPKIRNHPKITFIKNKNYLLGQTSSFQAGLTIAPTNTQGILLLPIDYPFVKVETINTLIKNFQNHHASILIPTYKNHRGHPPIFHSSWRDAFYKLDPSEGINSLIHQNESEVKIFPCSDPGVILTFNSPQEWEKIQAQRKSQS
ncbi:MAG: nucleotidyltransferase family protein, partial [Candidatus Omnitrophica bacterium]|nr:nucleotidyltransferase family protein [Candidatus Omnitrophota bacterium]